MTTKESPASPQQQQQSEAVEKSAHQPTNNEQQQPKKAPKRIIRRKRRPVAQQDYQIDPLLLQNVLQQSNLPTTAYSFEIVKTVQRCVQLHATHIALQLPEGLLLYATVLADVLQQLTPCLEQVSVLGDVTYGACCVDDLTAAQLGCQLLVHYGHSCLVPLQHTVLPVLYVFCEIQIATAHLVDCLEATLRVDNDDDNNNKQTTIIYLLGTVQFRHALATAQELLQSHGWDRVEIPQVKPLSPGEVLGCTSPILNPEKNHDAVVCFVADGRFHLESTLISNPHIRRFYRYDPYSRTMTKEAYGAFVFWKMNYRSAGRVF